LRLYHNSTYIGSGLLYDNLYKLCLDYSFSESLLFLNVTDVKHGIKRNREGGYFLQNYGIAGWVIFQEIECNVSLRMNFSQH
jgi:hypothetical protein